MTKRWLRPFMFVLLLLVGVVFVWPWVRVHLQAVAVLKTLSHEPLPWPVRAAAVAVTTREVSIPTKDGVLRGRVYEPVGVKHPRGMVIVHGVHHLGMNEPRLEAFARAMAGCGIEVLTPELPAIADYRIGSESVDAIGESASWFAVRLTEEQKHRQSVSVLGLSFSGGLALLAAERQEYASYMRMVFAIGSQASMQRVARYYRTGKAVRPDGTVETLQAHEYGPLVMEYEHVDEFVPAADRVALSAVLKQHLYEDVPAEQRAMSGLTAAQKLEVAQLLKADDARTVALLETNETRHAKEMEAVSPDRNLKAVETPVFLLHGEADNVIPASETLWLAKGLRPEVLQEALVSPLISHVEMGKSPGVGDEWRLVDFMAKVLRAAER